MFSDLRERAAQTQRSQQQREVEETFSTLGNHKASPSFHDMRGGGADEASRASLAPQERAAGALHSQVSLLESISLS